MGLYKSYGTDRQAEEDGKWERGAFRDGVAVKVRSTQSKAAKAAQDKINKRNQKYFKTGATVPADVQEKNEIELAIALTVDWEHVTDEHEQPLAFSEEAAKKVYRDLWEFRQQVIGVATQADTFRAHEEVEQEGN